MKNKKNTYLDKLNSIERRAKSIISDVNMAKKLYEDFELDMANNLSMKIEDTAERLVLTARELPVCTWKAGAKEELENQYSEILNIKVGITQTGFFAVILPLLLPKKERGSAEYIKQNLYTALSKFFQNKPHLKMKDVFIVYRHVYDETRPERGVRDHDNIEINTTTDAISTFVLEDDSSRICNHCYMSAEGNEERTEIYVVPKSRIKEWFDFEKTIKKEVVKLYENIDF